MFDPLPGGGAPSLDEVCANLDARRVTLPRYSQRLSSTRGRGFLAALERRRRFDVRDHMGHVAPARPGGDGELCDWAADFFSHRLDRTRPLWEMALIEGLAEGRWAIAQKTHHCLVDGVGSVDVAYLLLDTEPTRRSARAGTARCRRRRTRPAAVRARARRTRSLPPPTPAPAPRGPVCTRRCIRARRSNDRARSPS